jgi:uncharacterized membrane protein YebE (DUF533 family)
MLNPERLLGQLIQGGLSGGFGRGKKRKRGGSLLGGMSSGTKVQLGMGLLGVAIAAYEHYTKQNQGSSGGALPSPAPGPGAAPMSVPTLASMPKSSIPANDASLLVQAMVAAAAADGVIDEAEKAQMLQRATEAGFDEETRRFLELELGNPKSLAVIASSARPEIATDLYAASCAAITADTEAEKIYLATLAKRLGLSDEACAEVHRQLGMA